MASTAAAGKAASSITFCVSSLTASAAFSVPLLEAGGAAAGTVTSHADASLLAFSISASQGFDGTENHASLPVFVCGSLGVGAGALGASGSGAACSCSFTRATSSTAVAVSVELFAIATGELEVAHASLANGVLEIVPLSGAVSGIVTGAGAAVSVTRVLAAGAVSTASGFSSTGSQDSTGI